MEDNDFLKNKLIDTKKGEGFSSKISLTKLTNNLGKQEDNSVLLTEQEKFCQAFIEENKKTVSEALTGLIKGKKFILVGEHHLADCEPIRREIMLALPKLQKEGLTHVALEAETKYQDIIDNSNFSDPQIKNILKEKGIGTGWEQGNFDILSMAKLLGIKVVLIDFDDGRKDKDRDNAQWQNKRDSHMMETIQGQIDEKSKVLVFIGSGHVNKKPVESYQDGKAKRLGARLVEQYGDEAVSSIRHVNREANFDGLLDFMSKTSSPKKVSNNKKEVIIIPDQGPVKGDERMTASDYIITIF